MAEIRWSASVNYLRWPILRCLLDSGLDKWLELPERQVRMYACVYVYVCMFEFQEDLHSTFPKGLSPALSLDYYSLDRRSVQGAEVGEDSVTPAPLRI